MIGLVCPSTTDPFGRDQEAALRAVGCQALFSSRERTAAGVERVLAKALAGDQIVVTTLDRLAGSLSVLSEVSNVLIQKGIDLRVLNDGVDTSDEGWRGFLASLVVVANFKRATLSERTTEGLAAARARGQIGGRKPKIGEQQIKTIRRMYEATRPDGKRKYTVGEIALKFGVTRPTIYRHLGASQRINRPAESAI